MAEIQDNIEELPSESRYKQNFLLSLVILVISIVVIFFPKYFDFPIERFINNFATKSVIVDNIFFDLDSYFSLSGAILVAFIWACWFGTTDLELRARVLVGTVVSLGAGGISRFLQHALSSHPRPFYDQTFGFHLPSAVNQTPFNTWDSFPSDHAAVFCGLTVVMFIARPQLRLVAAAWFGLLEISRCYMGAHYPSDIVGGAALGACLVWSVQGPRPVSWGSRIVRWERSSPSLFYAGAFFVSYQIATLLQDFRSMTGGMHLIHGIVQLVARH